MAKGFWPVVPVQGALCGFLLITYHTVKTSFKYSLSDASLQCGYASAARLQVVLPLPRYEQILTSGLAEYFGHYYGSFLCFKAPTVVLWNFFSCPGSLSYCSCAGLQLLSHAEVIVLAALRHENVISFVAVVLSGVSLEPRWVVTELAHAALLHYTLVG